MKTEHFPSLELCKKLTEIRFPRTKESLYTDVKTGKTTWELNWSCGARMQVCPSVIEMLDIMPEVIKMNDNYWLSVGKNWAMYRSDNNDRRLIHSDSIPNALAEMILWLHENNYISFKK